MNLSLYRNQEFDRGAPGWKEALWHLVKNIFFLQSWPLPSAFRCFLLRIFGARIGKGVVIRSGVNVSFPWLLEIGHHVWLGEEVFILSLAPVSIGSHVCISQRALLCTGSHDFSRETFDLLTSPIDIQSHSWIAAGAFVSPGTVIGEHSMVTAGTVVSKHLPPHSVACGNPAQIRPRNSKELHENTPRQPIRSA
ncbi:MAG: WcaF family extracellular polysaccharide biosynthesis acetyltransferase [Verrucomicrobiota bacterium]